MSGWHFTQAPACYPSGTGISNAITSSFDSLFSAIDAMHKNVTFLIASLAGGGIQKATVRLVAEFIRNGYAVTLVAVNAQGPVRKEVPENCELVDLECLRAGRALIKLMRYLSASKPEVLISAQTHINLLAILARALSGQPRRLVVCEHIALHGARQGSRGLFEILRPLLIRLFYPAASKVVAVSRAAAQSLSAFGLKQEVQVIHNGLDTAKIRVQASEQVGHPWLAQDDFKLVLGIGRLSAQKNFRLLLRAFALLPGARNRLIILGEGPEQAQLLALAEELGVLDRVDFPGFVDNPFPFLARCNAFVLSSKWEGFANVVIEALACGAPIISTDCPGGPGEIFENGRYGRLVPLDDVPALAGAIQQCLEQTVDKKALIRFSQQFSIQNTAARYIMILESMN